MTRFETRMNLVLVSLIVLVLIIISGSPPGEVGF